MNEKQKKEIGKFLSLILRHSPETIQIKLDENGWADTAELISRCAKRGKTFTQEDLEEIVRTNDKQRYAFNEDNTKIRANQGHSIEVDLALKTAEPPEFLFHGTVSKFVEAIRKEGLQKMSRQHVHLSEDKTTAEKVGSRRGVPVILTVRSGEMHQDGVVFYLSENGVWLTDQVPAKYINF
ncbi:RNA 2'-phosphotransferase [Taibaiella soli]|uniref:Probable RNA 2'-phosphotransferase n=1 Tax=Taibaiella soli TaxID=1649169 RepID=A0A2W2B6M2_9BACT|nr:RNA 2'-phosphotransferase [Taibaiella soli]PZF71647.1 RNA 2'-phosphotransferase [Taibaiella soli]